MALICIIDTSAAMGTKASDGLSLLDHAKISVSSTSAWAPPHCQQQRAATRPQAEVLIKERLKKGMGLPGQNLVITTAPEPHSIIVDWSTPPAHILARIRNIAMGDVGDVQQALRTAHGMASVRAAADGTNTWLHGLRPWATSPHCIVLLTSAWTQHYPTPQAPMQQPPLPGLDSLMEDYAVALGGGALPALPMPEAGLTLRVPQLSLAMRGGSLPCRALQPAPMFPLHAVCRLATAHLSASISRWDTRLYALALCGLREGEPAPPLDPALRTVCVQGGGRAVSVPTLRVALSRCGELVDKLQSLGPKVHLQVGTKYDADGYPRLPPPPNAHTTPLMCYARQIQPLSLSQGSAAEPRGLWPLAEHFMPTRAPTTTTGHHSRGAGGEPLPDFSLPPRPSMPTITVRPARGTEAPTITAHVLHVLDFPADVYTVAKCALSDALFADFAAAQKARNRQAKAVAARNAAAAAAGDPGQAEVAPTQLSASVRWPLSLYGSHSSRTWHSARQKAHEIAVAAQQEAVRDAGAWREDAGAWVVKEDAWVASQLNAPAPIPVEEATARLRSRDLAGAHDASQKHRASDAQGGLSSPWGDYWAEQSTPEVAEVGFMAMSSDPMVGRLLSSQGLVGGHHAASSVTGVLVLLPYDYRTLFKLLIDLSMAARALPPTAVRRFRSEHSYVSMTPGGTFLRHAVEKGGEWLTSFTKYMKQVPGYYLTSMYTALERYGLAQLMVSIVLAVPEPTVRGRGAAHHARNLSTAHSCWPAAPVQGWVEAATRGDAEAAAQLMGTSLVHPAVVEQSTALTAPRDDDDDTRSVSSVDSTSSFVSTLSGYAWDPAHDEAGEPAAASTGIRPAAGVAELSATHAEPVARMSNYTQAVQRTIAGGLRNPLQDDPDGDRLRRVRAFFGNPFAYRNGRRPAGAGRTSFDASAPSVMVDDVDGLVMGTGLDEAPSEGMAQPTSPDATPQHPPHAPPSLCDLLVPASTKRLCAAVAALRSARSEHPVVLAGRKVRVPGGQSFGQTLRSLMRARLTAVQGR